MEHLSNPNRKNQTARHVAYSARWWPICPPSRYPPLPNPIGPARGVYARTDRAGSPVARLLYWQFSPKIGGRHPAELYPMRGKGNVVSAFLDKLAEGDAVAVGFVVGFVVIGALAGLFVWKTARDLRREDEAMAKRRGRKLP